jgi:hypothetical protein
MISKEEFQQTINNPKTYKTKQECIDGIFPIVEFALKHYNISIGFNNQFINSSQIIPIKPDINDEGNIFALFCLYSKIIGEPVTKTLIKK